MTQQETLKRLGSYKVIQQHDDGDLTVESAGKLYVVTTYGRLFEEAPADSTTAELLLYALEHTATGGGRVVDRQRARQHPCKCFSFEDQEYCWAKGVLGLMSSKKNPEQIQDICVLPKEQAGDGVKKRFGQIQSAVSEAHREWEQAGGGLPEWWSAVGDKLREKGITL